METIADVLMGAGACAAAFYCFVLSRRLTAFQNSGGEIGAAVTALSVKVDALTETLQQAQSAARASSADLSKLTERAEKAAQNLELMMASLHDIPEASEPKDLEQTRAKSTPEMPIFTTSMQRG